MQKILLFGASNGGIRVSYLLGDDYEILAYIDNDPNKQGKTLLGKPIISLGQIKFYDFDLILIASVHWAGMRDQLVNDLKVPEEKMRVLDYFIDGICDVRLCSLKLVADEIYAGNVEGNTAELGVYRGDFAKYINSVFPDKRLYLFDTFEGFAASDVENDIQRGYSNSVIGQYCNPDVELVLNKMRHKGNCVIKKGYFPETANGVEDLFAFVNIDVDLYQPIYEGLKYFYPRLSKGGYIFIHDYNNIEFFGVKEAVRRYCHENGISFVPMSDLGGSVIITK